jgi:ribosome maturation factor RimP
MPPPRPVRPSAGPLPGQLHGVLEPIVAGAGFELDELDVRATGRRHTVKVVIDSDAGVGLDDIARLSRAAAAELDQHEHLIGGSYTLEVTSPGVDRPLTLPRHWRRATERLVQVDIAGIGPDRRARVVTADDDGVLLDIDGDERHVVWTDLGRGRVQIEFNRKAMTDQSTPENDE